jgi:CDP-glycerol glycerophosphotransferase
MTEASGPVWGAAGPENSAAAVKPKDPRGSAQRPAGVPRITIVIPVSGVADQLADCLDSILAQQFAGLQVIAVDDCSPDRCGEILDEYARRDARLRPVHLAAAAGPGGARNIGLDRAAGDYVWFVDADDLVTDGAIAAVASRLARTEPDVLLIDFGRLQPSGAVEPNAWRHLLREPSSPRVFTLRERPEVIRLTMASWGKVIRRGYLAGLGLRFEQGIHEDVPFTCALLMDAKRIATLDTVCYLYRQRRPGALTNTPSYANFQVFTRYEKVFAAIGSRAAGPGPFLPLIFERAIWHYATVLDSPRCVPRRARREFFHRMSGHFSRFRPPGYSYPPGLRAVKYRLVERDAYLAYLAVRPVNQARIALRELLRRARQGR